jgi:hypothetical protein
MNTTCLSELTPTLEDISTGLVLSSLGLNSIKSIALTYATLNVASAFTPEEWDPIWSHWRKKATLGNKTVKMSLTLRKKYDLPNISDFSIFYFIQRPVKSWNLSFDIETQEEND